MLFAASGPTARDIFDRTHKGPMAGARTREYRQHAIQGGGGILTIPIVGPLMHRADNWAGATSYEGISAQLRQAFAGSAKVIILDIDSAGGELGGLLELADEIFNARSRKRIIAVANAVAGSAAYLLGAAAGEFVATPSATVGDIGVVDVHQDVSEQMAKAGFKMTVISAGPNKWQGHPFAPLEDDARDHMQSIVNGFNRDIVTRIARFRGLNVAFVNEQFGQGSTFKAEAALRRGMVDRVATLADVKALSHRAANSRRTFAAAEQLDRRRELLDELTRDFRNN